MSKLLLYCLLVMAVYVLVIFPLNNKDDDSKTEKKESKTDKSLAEKDVDENGISKGASGQAKYRIGLY